MWSTALAVELCEEAGVSEGDGVELQAEVVSSALARTATRATERGRGVMRNLKNWETVVRLT